MTKPGPIDINDLMKEAKEAISKEECVYSSYINAIHDNMHILIVCYIPPTTSEEKEAVHDTSMGAFHEQLHAALLDCPIGPKIDREKMN